MPSPTLTPSNSSQERQVWESLKHAIASSSGFQSWKREKISNTEKHSTSLDYQVRHYLRETLETLAY